MKKLFILLIVLLTGVYAASAAVGDLVGTVDFDARCSSGIGVGIAFDGENLWFSCYDSATDLYKADPLNGTILESYSIDGGLGALAYDAGRNAIWAGWGGDGTNGQIYLISLDGAKEVDGVAEPFVAGAAGVNGIDDGLAYDAGDDTLYVSADVVGTIHHYAVNGSYIGGFAKAPGSACGSSGLAIGGSLLYQGFNGCNMVIVVDKSATAVPVFSFSTVVPGDSEFRDEDLECDTNTFNKHVMWSVEAYEPRRASAFEIPADSCGIGGEPADDGNDDNNDNEVPEFGILTAIGIIGLAGIFVYRRRK